MKIHDSLKNKCDNSDNPVIKKLCIIAEDVVGKIKPHLKQITSELPEFDIHDETHSEKIIENIERLLGDRIINELSAYELFFMYLSAFLHDAAMALPKWEHNLLRLTEGQTGFYHNDVKNPLLYDGKPPMKLSEAREYVMSHKEQLYEKYEQCKDYILAFKTEEELINDLSEQLTSYQDFRNGYISKLNKAKSDLNAYLKLSDEIRYEYIRENHAIRIEKLVNNLAKVFDDQLDIKVGKKLTKTLATICRAHGESFNYIQKLNFDDTYFGEGSVNTQFLCMMLRLGDILHFSYDRAPDSLYAEKMISAKESRKQWKVKSQAVINSIVSSEGILRIKYDAFCDVPSFYYYLKDYFSWIEEEITNYNKIIKTMKQNTEFCQLASKYEINISDTIDSKGVRYDEEIFKPVDGLCFKLNQSKILELLMGANLYKDKFLCLRELYQNSLDTCRNMISCNPDYKGYIEFGLGQEMVDDIQKQFLYCLDNGMGMNLDIINKYFLNIGNSYYRSKDFYRENAKYGNKFTPTSQFGIGVLSCFMLADKIYVSTKHKGDNVFTRFMIDGPHEKFYYVNGNKFDDKENQIGEHGTIIKLYLNENTLLNDKVIDCFDILETMKNDYVYTEECKEEEKSEVTNNLLYLLQSFIGYSQDNISINIKLEDKKLHKLIQLDSLIINLKDLVSSDKMAEILLDRYYANNETKKDTYNKFIANKEKIDILEVTTQYEGINYKSIIALPKEKIHFKLFEMYNEPAMKLEVLIDGITVEESSNIREIFLNRTGRAFVGTLNFAGEVRPQLSVDRNSIVDADDSVQQALNNLRKLIAKELIEVVGSHIINQKIEFDSDVAKDIWEYIFSKYLWLEEALIDEVRMCKEIQIYIDDINKISTKAMSLKELIECEEYTYKIYNIEKFTPIIKNIIFNKIINSNFVTVSDEVVILKNCKYVANLDKEKFNRSGENLVRVINENYGKYNEYDIINDLFPLVKMETYKKIINKNINEYMGKVKTGGRYSRYSSIMNFGRYVDARMVYPSSGIFSARRYYAKANTTLVGRKEEFIKFDTRDVFEDYFSRGAEDYFIYAYICPAILNDREKEKIKKYKIIDEEYYNGVINGWSILFLGATGETIIVPGIATKNDMLKKINDSFWTINQEVKYYLLDGTNITKEYIEKL